IGVAIAAFAGFVLVPMVGWRWVMIGSSVTALLALVMRRSLHLPNTPGTGLPHPRVLLEAGVLPRMGLAWALGVFKLGTYWTCYRWLPGFLTENMHQSLGKSLGWIFTAQVGQFLGMLCFGQVADRFGRRPAFTAYSLLTACAIAPLAFAWPFL